MAEDSPQLVSGRARAFTARAPLAGVLTAPWLWVGVVMVAALLVAVPYVLRFSQYVVMPDELGYSKQALWFAQHHRPSVPGDPWFNSYAQLGPLLFSPAYGLLTITTAFDVSHAISAVVFVSTAVPVYLLARLVTRDRAAAVLAAALSIAVPWLAMAATLMTEPIAYAASAWALLAMTRALERPAWRRDIVALLAILLAALARTQLAILGAAFVLAAVVLLLLPTDGARPRPATALRAHWPLAVAAIAGVVAIASPSLRSDLLGSYAGPVGGELLPPGTWAAGRELLAYVVVGVGGIPLALAAAWIALTLGGRSSVTPARAFAAVALCAGVLLVVVTGSFTVRYTGGINDRYLIFVVPVLVVASVAMLVERRPATIPIAVAGLLTGVLIATSQLAQAGPSLVSPSQTFHQVLSGKTLKLASILGWHSLSMPVLVGALVGAAVVVLALARPPAGPRGRRGVAGGEHPADGIHAAPHGADAGWGLRGVPRRAGLAGPRGSGRCADRRGPGHDVRTGPHTRRLVGPQPLDQAPGSALSPTRVRSRPPGIRRRHADARPAHGPAVGTRRPRPDRDDGRGEALQPARRHRRGREERVRRVEGAAPVHGGVDARGPERHRRRHCRQPRHPAGVRRRPSRDAAGDPDGHPQPVLRAGLRLPRDGRRCGPCALGPARPIARRAPAAERAGQRAGHHPVRRHRPPSVAGAPSTGLKIATVAVAPA